MIEQLRILGKRYRVRFIDTKPVAPFANDTFGQISCMHQTIDIRADQGDDHRCETLLHEAIHALDYDMQTELEERQVHTIAAGLYGLLRDNPDLFAMIAATA